jgi:hypothetical protein
VVPGTADTECNKDREEYLNERRGRRAPWTASAVRITVMCVECVCEVRV